MNQLDPGGKSELIQGDEMFAKLPCPIQASSLSHSILRTVTTIEPNPARKRATSSCGYGAHWPESESTLELALIYEDARTEAWTREVEESLAGPRRINPVHGAGWKLSDLSQTEELAEAVSATCRADVIVTALYAAEELPLGFCYWVDAWLLRRPQVKGVFVGLVAALEGSEAWYEPTENYLRAIARRGALEFFVGRYELPLKRLTSPAASSLRRSSAPGSLKAYEHWGLNE